MFILNRTVIFGWTISLRLIFTALVLMRAWGLCCMHKLCDGTCVKGQLLWYERGPALMQWVNTWRNRENKHRRRLFWTVHYRIHHAPQLLARVPDVTLRGFQLFEGSFVRILMVSANNMLYYVNSSPPNTECSRTQIWGCKLRPCLHNKMLNCKKAKRILHKNMFFSKSRKSKESVRKTVSGPT